MHFGLSIRNTLAEVTSTGLAIAHELLIQIFLLLTFFDDFCLHLLQHCHHFPYWIGMLLHSMAAAGAQDQGKHKQSGSHGTHHRSASATAQDLRYRGLACVLSARWCVPVR